MVGTVVVVLATALAAVVGTRSPKVQLPFALLGAYVARRAGLQVGFIKWFDHRVLERVSDTFDNVEGWLVGLMVVTALLLVLRGGPRPHDDASDGGP